MKERVGKKGHLAGGCCFAGGPPLRFVERRCEWKMAHLWRPMIAWLFRAFPLWWRHERCTRIP